MAGRRSATSAPETAPPSPALIADLRAEWAQHARASSAVRPEVVSYLIARGLEPLHRALVSSGEPPEALCRPVWTLMLASVSARRFGVSTDAWANNPDYPDRWFPLLWLRLAPSLLPRLPAPERLPCTAALFNLGEQLAGPLRSTANRLMAALVQVPGDLVPDWRRGLERALVAAGLLAPPAVPPAEWRRAVVVGTLDLAVHDTAFLPGAVSTLEARTFAVGDPEGGRVARVLADAAGLTVLGIDHADVPFAALRSAGPPLPGAPAVELTGRKLVRRGPGGTPAQVLLEDVPAVAPTALAVGPFGDVLLVDAASQHLTLLRLTR
jgi:hypothetical protein